MSALEEIREVVNETTDELIKLQTWNPCRGNGKPLRRMEIILAKAQAFDKISEIMEQEERNWWN